MKQFLNKYNNKIKGVLSTFDRMIFKGHILPLFSKKNRHYFLNQEKVLIKDFGKYAKDISDSIKNNAKGMAERSRRTYRYLESNRESKEEIAKEIREREGIREGLICVLSGVEPCMAFDVRYNQEEQKLEVINRTRKCLFIYFYYQDRQFGFIHVRIQTWFPFQVQIYINGREWLAKQLDKKGIGYNRYENSFIDLDDLKTAQKIADRNKDINMARIFNGIIKQINPFMARIRKILGVGYYWVLDQGEYATDVMFKDRGELVEIYPELTDHALVCFNSTDVMRFLGRKLNGNFKGEIVTDVKKRPEGFRIKHRMKKNSIKMYDKWNVLRIETTINNPREFKVYREVERKGERVMKWVPMGKSVFNIYRYAEVSKASNSRYLDSLSSILPLNECVKELEQCAQAIQEGSNRYSGFNLISKETTKLFEAVLDGSNCINGFKNTDLKEHLFANSSKEKDEVKKQSGKVTRLIRKLRAHKLVGKIPRSHKYKVTEKGYRILGTSLKLKKRDFPKTMKLAA